MQATSFIAEFGLLIIKNYHRLLLMIKNRGTDRRRIRMIAVTSRLCLLPLALKFWPCFRTYARSLRDFINNKRRGIVSVSWSTKEKEGREKRSKQRRKRSLPRCGRGECDKLMQLTSRCRGVESAPGSGRVIGRQLIGIMNDDPLGRYALALSSLSGDRRCWHRAIMLPLDAATFLCSFSFVKLLRVSHDRSVENKEARAASRRWRLSAGLVRDKRHEWPLRNNPDKTRDLDKCARI